jgi:hypothetical protein
MCQVVLFREGKKKKKKKKKLNMKCLKDGIGTNIGNII